ncbi:hypothetical protein ACWGMA_29630 [Streptomyces asiaticus]
MTTGFFPGREGLRHVDVAIGAEGQPGSNDQRTHVIDVSEIGAFLGLDVGKGEHHATADVTEPNVLQVPLKIGKTTATEAWLRLG